MIRPGVAGHGIRPLKTDPGRGLTDADVARALCLLGSIKRGRVCDSTSSAS